MKKTFVTFIYIYQPPNLDFRTTFNRCINNKRTECAHKTEKRVHSNEKVADKWEQIFHSPISALSPASCINLQLFSCLHTEGTLYQYGSISSNKLAKIIFIRLENKHEVYGSPLVYSNRIAANIK